MVVGFVSNHHFYGGRSGHGKGGMYSAGRMDALMERQDGVQGTLRQDTPERLHQDGRDTTRSAVKSSITRHDHVDETRGKKNPVPVMVSPAARPQPPKSPARSKEEPPSIQNTKQYSSKRIHEGKEDMFPPPQRSVGAKKKIPPASCRIHVWDAERKAPGLGFSACNISDVWPFDHPGSGIDGMYRTAHQNAPHAIGYWLAEAVKKSALYEENFDRADLILLNTYVVLGFIISKGGCVLICLFIFFVGIVMNHGTTFYKTVRLMFGMVPLIPSTKFLYRFPRFWSRD